jgi:hypothetical protein
MVFIHKQPVEQWDWRRSPELDLVHIEVLDIIKVTISDQLFAWIFKQVVLRQLVAIWQLVT